MILMFLYLNNLQSSFNHFWKKDDSTTSSNNTSWRAFNWFAFFCAPVIKLENNLNLKKKCDSLKQFLISQHFYWYGIMCFKALSFRVVWTPYGILTFCVLAYWFSVTYLWGEGCFKHDKICIIKLTSMKIKGINCARENKPVPWDPGDLY